MTQLLAKGINEAYVAQRRTDVVEEVLDGETVVWDGHGRSLHILNRTATIVWQCLDGATDIHQIARELSEAFGVDREEMASDVLETVRSFGDQGLLKGVAGVEKIADEEAQPAKGRDVAVSQEPNHQPRFLPPPPGG